MLLNGFQTLKLCFGKKSKPMDKERKVWGPQDPKLEYDPPVWRLGEVLKLLKIIRIDEVDAKLMTKAQAQDMIDRLEG